MPNFTPRASLETSSRVATLSWSAKESSTEYAAMKIGLMANPGSPAR